MPNDARTQAALAASSHFRSRLRSALAKVAWQILDESPTTPDHVARAGFARGVINSLDSHVNNLVGSFVVRTNILSATTSFDFNLAETGAVVTAATDAAIESQLATDWSHLAGINT